MRSLLQNLKLLSIGAALCLTYGCNQQPQEEEQTQFSIPAADPDNGSITLPDGFSAFVVADDLGKTRHLTVNENGDIYAKLRNEVDSTKSSGIVALRDTNGDGRADVTEYFGKYGGTGIDIHNNYLYYSSDSMVFRYSLEGEQLVPEGEPETIIAELPVQSQHAAKSLAFDGEGNMYVNIGAPSNACQDPGRTPEVPGQDPCPLLEKHGGIWQFNDSTLDQTQDADGYRYATGIRNAVAITWNNTAGELYGLQHGRDQLNSLWPDLFTEDQSVNLPAEEFLLIKDGSDFGWPYCYYDSEKQQKILGPEYGGDGEEVGRCAEKDDPIMAFPAHWAPNDIVFYEGDQFPEKYKNGAFIAFHGSWNRAPQEQKGYNVVFVPFENGMPSGEYEVFANQFAGDGSSIESPGDAEFRPCGLAIGPNGTLFISDDVKGRIWQVSYEGAQMAMK